MKDYFTHKMDIPVGKHGEISKIVEELLELKDAMDQKKTYFSFIESADLITTVGSYMFEKKGIPLLAIVLMAYARKPYKFIRDIYFRLTRDGRFSNIEEIDVVINGVTVNLFGVNND